MLTFPVEYFLEITCFKMSCFGIYLFDIVKFEEYWIRKQTLLIF